MRMQMFGVMFGLADRVTLSGMLNVVEKEMELTTNPDAGGGMHAHGGGHGASSKHEHESSGWGDAVFSVLVDVWRDGRHRVHTCLGLGLPTADVEEKQDGLFLPYGMQLGSGVWNVQPSVTYVGRTDTCSWGAQARAQIGLENRNDAGFSFGDQASVTAWGAYALTETLSASGRLLFAHQDEIDEHYNGAHGHTAPPHFQENYGGDRVDAGLGLNWLITGEVLSGHRLAIEFLFPIDEDVNGVQMTHDQSVIVGWQKSW
ncbi:MAG: hypothetical protein ACI9OU_000003 [Candidatus Promineifilaceae bacterium]|jgi:hypothetical protein